MYAIIVTLPILLLFLALCCSAPVSASDSYPAQAPASEEDATDLNPARLQALLQNFVDSLYLKAFRHLGDERDFDHGHILYAPSSRKPVAILYHTQELAHDQPPGGEFSYVDPTARNWIQWIDRDGIENADRYLRSEYPSTAAWRWFQAERLPVLNRYHTIVDKMLDPRRLGAETNESQQWEFTRIECSSPPQAHRGQTPIDIRLPTGERVCLTLKYS